MSDDEVDRLHAAALRANAAARVACAKATEAQKRMHTSGPEAVAQWAACMKEASRLLQVSVVATNRYLEAQRRGKGPAAS